MVMWEKGDWEAPAESVLVSAVLCWELCPKKSYLMISEFYPQTTPLQVWGKLSSTAGRNRSIAFCVPSMVRSDG